MVPGSIDGGVIVLHVARLTRYCAAAALAVTARAGAQVALPPVGYEVQSWGLADGMPQGSVGSLALDGPGYLWMGSGVGPIRFDGDTFVTYRFGGAGVPDPVRTLTPDNAGGLFILFPERALGQVNKEHRYRDLPVVLPEGRMHLAATRDGGIWMSTISGVRRLQGQAFVAVPTLPDSAVGDIRVLRAAKDGGLWVGGSLGLVRVSPEGSATRLERAGCREVYDVAPIHADEAWVASCRGLERITSWRATLVLAAPDSLAPRRLHLEDTGTALWVAGPMGVQRFDLEGTRPWRDLKSTFAHSLDLGGTVVGGIVGDGYGGAWIGTGGAGLRRVRRLAARRITVALGLPAGPMHHLAPDGAGGMWMGGCGGLARWHDGRVDVSHPPAHGLISNCIRGLLHASDGALWVGQQNGLVRSGADGHSRVVFRPLDPREDVAPMLEDQARRTWFATSRGTIGYFPPGRDVPTLLPEGTLPRTWARAMIASAAGGIWVGQDQHVAHLQGTVVTRRLGKADGVPPGPVRTLLADGDSGLFIGSYGGGLAHSAPGTGVRRLLPSSEIEQMVSAMGRDQSGRLWIYGDFGLIIVPEAEVRAALGDGRPMRTALRLSARDGVPEGNGGFPSAWADTSGTLWLATVDGVSVVPLEATAISTPSPPPRIDRVALDTHVQDIADSVTAAPSVDVIAFSVSAPRLVPGQPGMLYYRLRGHDRAWIPSGGMTVARYSNLRPGRYVFEVAGDTTVASRPGQQVPIHVLPAWWESPLARLAWLILAAAAIWAGGAWFTRRVRARNRVLEREISERERAERQAARAASDLAHVSRLATAGELATSIAHELNQPLAAVMAHAEQARRLTGGAGPPELEPALNAIVDQSERAAEVIRSLRAFVLKQSPADQPVHLQNTVADTLRLLERELATRGVQVEVRDERTTRWAVTGQPVQLQQVLANLLLNASEAMSVLPREQRRIDIVLAEEGLNAARLTVADRGRGVGAEEVPRIFEPFFSTKDGGLGLGLSLSRSIAEAHGGRLYVSNRAGGGAAFHLVLPVERP